MYGRGPCDGNQLEWILSQYNSRAGVRRSMFQAATFDPARDHVASAQLGFPCLQQVSFEPTAGWPRRECLLRDPADLRQSLWQLSRPRSARRVHGARDGTCRLARLNVMVGVAKLERHHQERCRFRTARRRRRGARDRPSQRRRGLPSRSWPQGQHLDEEASQARHQTSARPPAEIAHRS